MTSRLGSDESIKMNFEYFNNTYDTNFVIFGIAFIYNDYCFVFALYFPLKRNLASLQAAWQTLKSTSRVQCM